MICEITNNFFIPDGKNTQLSKVVNTWTFDRLTPNGNEGVGVKLDYLERAMSMFHGPKNTEYGRI